MKNFLIHNAPLLCVILVLFLFLYYSNKDRTFKLIAAILLIASVLFMLAACSPGRCQPSKRSRDYGVRSWWSKQQSDGYWVHYRQVGFKPQTAYRFECKLSSAQLDSFYSK